MTEMFPHINPELSASVHLRRGYSLERILSLWVLCVQVWDEQRSRLSHDLGRHLAELHIWGKSRGQGETQCTVSVTFNNHQFLLGSPQQTTVQTPYINIKRSNVKKASAMCWLSTQTEAQGTNLNSFKLCRRKLVGMDVLLYHRCFETLK